MITWGVPTFCQPGPLGFSDRMRPGCTAQSTVTDVCLARASTTMAFNHLSST